MNKKSAIGNLVLMFLPLALAFPITYGFFIFLHRPLIFLAISSGLTLLGFFLFVLSKMPIYKKAVWWRFGYGGMSTRSKRIYLTGYLFMSLGVCGLLLGFFAGIG